MTYDGPGVEDPSGQRGENIDKDEEQTRSDSSTPFEQPNAAPERGLLLRGRHLFKNVVKDADEDQPGHEGNPDRVRLDVGGKEIDSIDLSRTLGVKVIIETGVRVKQSTEGGVTEKHLHQ